MLSSKANAALARLKEIEEKYKMKRKEQKWKEDADSSISSVSIVPSPRRAARPKLDIKMPDTRFEGHEAEETRLSSKSERSMPDEAGAIRPAEDAVEIGLDVATPLDDKSPRSAGKHESLISDVTTIQESSLIESVLDDTVTPSKSSSRASRRNSSAAGGRSSERKERTRTAARPAGGGSESVKSSEISRGKAPSDNSSIPKRLRLSEKSRGKISRVRRDLRKRSVGGDAKMPKPTDSRGDTNESGSTRDDSVIEDSIDTMENSEIISELSRAEESSVAKIEDPVLGGSKRPTHASEASNSSKGPMAESGYANDTFEDISSSTISSQREEMINERREVVDGAGSGAKQIDMAEYRSYPDSTEKHRDRLVALNSAPKSNATKVDSGSSNYVNDFESVVANPDNVRSIKLPQSVDLVSQRERYQHRKASFRDENISSVASSDKNASDSSESSTGDVTKTNEKKNSPGMTTVRQEGGWREREEASNRAKERAVIDVTGMPVANDDEDDWIESAKSNLSLEEEETRREHVSDESFDQRISQDAEYVPRKSHKDAPAKQYASSKIATKASESSSDSKTVPKIQNASRTRRVTAREENESCRSSERNKVSDRNCREHHTKTKKKKGARITNSKSAGSPESTGSRKEDKASRFDRKQTRGPRKQIVEMRLRQEREDLQKYLHELKNLRLESGSTQSYFRPLEFPKIAEFTQPDLESKPDDRFRERVSAIRRWLKDQYVLYRDYSTMAQAINAHYVPTTLDDAKKTIRELRKTTIKTR